MYVFGIDIGGTNIKIGFFDLDCKLIDKWSIKSNYETIFIDLASSIKKYLKKKGISLLEVKGFGIGVPGQVKNNIAVRCVNLNWNNINVKEEFLKALGAEAEVVVENDANLAAYGEYYNENEKYQNLILITLGTGVGSGIIVNGEILRGAKGLTGEIGHIRVDKQFNFECNCGGSGCLETVASANGILKLANYLQITKAKGKIYKSTKHVIECARIGDKIAGEAFDIACQNLAKVMAILSLVTDPEAILFGGGVSGAGDFLLEGIKKHFMMECLDNSKNIEIRLSRLLNDAGIYGGAALITKLIKKGEK